MEFSRHFNQMVTERNISVEWVHRALEDPDQKEDRADGTRHFLKKIDENEGRWLRVIVNVQTNPPRVVTTFFDRRLRRTDK